MKGLFIPEITAEMFKSGCLESIEALMAVGEIYDIEYQQWIPCSERLPEINQTVLLSTTDGEVIVGYRYRPDIVWQVTTNDGRKIWVYDPENYPGNIDELPKAETCGFEDRDNCWLSVTSINYDLKFAGILAWMPLPEPPKEVDHETD